MENNQNLNNQVNQNNNVNQPIPNNNTNKIVFVLMALLIVGLAGYIVYSKFIQKNDNPKPNDTQTQEKTNINYDVLNYKCKKEYCDSEDYTNVKELLKTSDRVRTIFDSSNDHKNHAVLLENASTGNVYLYSVDNDKYYFKNDNYYHIDIVTGGYESGGYIWDNNYVIVHQRITKHYETVDVETANSKIYSLRDEKYVFESDENYECSYAEYQNKRFYRLTNNGDSTLYDNKFNKLFEADTYGGFAFDTKYIFGIIEENSKYRFFRYNIAEKKYILSNVMPDVDGSSDCTYNYIVKYNNGEYEVFDFDGNSIFKTDEKSNLKNIKAKDYVLPQIPQLYYSKAENKVKLVIEPDICGDESCPPHFGYSYYEYDMGSKKLTYKFFTDRISDNISQNLIDGYVQFSY